MPKPSKGWKAPITGQGKACRRCKRGNLCPSHRPAKSAKSEGKRGPYKLNRGLINDLPNIVGKSRCFTDIWEALGIHHTTFYAWLDAGQKDAEEGGTSLERQFYEIVVMQRRLLAQRMVGAAVRSAEGVWREVVETDKDGKETRRVYREPPQGVLAMKIASRIDPVAMPPEKQTVEHSGGLTVAMEARERLRSAFKEGE